MEYKKIFVSFSISFLILFTFTSIFAVKELPNCCPSKVNEDVIWNYINKIHINSSDSVKQNSFNFYYNQFNLNIENCKKDLNNYYTKEYQNELERYSEFDLGFKSGDIINWNENVYDEYLNKEISKRDNEVNYFINNDNSIDENGVDIILKLNPKLSQFAEKEFSSKLYNYGKISGEVFDSCYKSSIIYTCYYPCHNEIDSKNDEIIKEKNLLFDEGKNDEVSSIDYLDYTSCYNKCGIQEDSMVQYFKEIDECSDDKISDFKWIIPFMEKRRDVLNECNSIYQDEKNEFKGVYAEPIGDSLNIDIDEHIVEKKKEISQEDLTPSNIKLKTWGDDLTEGKNYKLHISTNFFGKDSNGYEMPMSSFKIPTLKFKYDLPKNAKLTLKYKIDSTYLKDSSTLEGDIWISKANLQGITKPIEVEVFISDYPKNSKIITIYPRKRLKILSLTKIKENTNAWDDSWSTYKLTVNDPENKYIKYTIFSTSQNSQIFVNGFQYNKIATYTGKEQTIKFGWKAPKISKDARINYAKHLESLTTNIAVKGWSEILGNTLNSAVPNPTNIKKRFDNAMTTIGTANAGKQVYSSISGPENGEDWSFYLTKNLVNGFVNTEGYFGEYLDKSPFSLQYKLVSYSLVPMQEWYLVVDEMINISKAKIISTQEKIIVTAENNLGDKDTAEYVVTINGFERVLK